MTHYSTQFVEFYGVFFVTGSVGADCETPKDVEAVWHQARFGNVGKSLGSILFFPLWIIPYFMMRNVQSKLSKSDC